MAERKISLAGVWLWLWGPWHLLWISGFVVVPWLGAEVARMWFTWLYVAFLPLEIVGAMDMRDDAPAGNVRRAKTLSQWRQYVAGMAKEGGHPLLSWRAVAGGSGLLDALVMGVLVTGNVAPVFGHTVAVAVGVLFGATVAAWLVPHFGWRERHG